MSKEILNRIKEKYMPEEHDFNLGIHDIDWFIQQAEQKQKYATVIKHLKNTHDNFRTDDGKQLDWISGWGAAIDYLDENMHWEETYEAKTIVEENEELTERVRELESKTYELEVRLEGAHKYNDTMKIIADGYERQSKLYRRELENAMYFIKHSRHEPDKARIMQESIEKLLEGK